MVYFFVISLLLSELHTSYRTYGGRDTTYSKLQLHKMTISEVLKKYTDRWMKIPGVIGTGEGESGGKPCIKVFTEHNSKLIKKKVPKTAEGYKVVLEETGKIKTR